MASRRRSRSSRPSRSSRRGGSRSARSKRARFGNVLDIGRSFFTGPLKLHRYSGSLRITDMRNAGKRGKKVREMTVLSKSRSDAETDAHLRQVSSLAMDKDYDQLKAALTPVPEHLTVHERELRGVDVEPSSTTFRLAKEFPDGAIVEIESSPHTFHVKHSTVISAPNKAAHGFRQDTLYGPASKKDGQLFYAWLKEHLHAAGQMTMHELRKLWNEIGVKYDGH